ncbi:MAG: NnrU family protein [Alphaproteobacteria bacterium]|nr:NnrU family protein [Alphaproteobacteria bacterium]OJU56073.1 MAG: NnrU family protein [Alphaproteobacteria bacterium 62-8]
MGMLIAAAAVFLGIHLLVAGTRARDAVTGTIGENAYLGLFSLASLGGIVWLVVAYNGAQAGGENELVYDLGVGVRHLAPLVVLLAFLLAVPGLLLPNPTSVRQEGAATRADAVKGVLAITRHPFLWGVALWAAMHLLANGDTASVLFFGTFLVLALLGTFSIDAKRRRKLGAAWDGFAARTSNLPFAALASGRAKLKWREILDWRLAVAVVLYLALLFGHQSLMGVSPFATG